MELLAFASRQFAPKIVDPFVCFIRICSIPPYERVYRAVQAARLSKRLVQ